jgi:hypothetical protein
LKNNGILTIFGEYITPHQPKLLQQTRMKFVLLLALTVAAVCIHEVSTEIVHFDFSNFGKLRKRRQERDSKTTRELAMARKSKMG